MEENLGGRLDLHKNIAFWMLEEGDSLGAVHPRDAQLPETVLLLCARIQDMAAAGTLSRREDECIAMTEKQFEETVLGLRDQWKGAWSKEYREMEPERFLENVKSYMRDWLLMREQEGQVILLPTVGKLRGYYPDDFEGGGKP